MKHLWTKWKTNPPASGAPVIGSYDDPPEKEGAMHVSGFKCKSGCCFQGKGMGSMMLPTWWRPDSTAAGE